MNYIVENKRTIYESKIVYIIIYKLNNKYVVEFYSNNTIIVREYELVWYN